MNDFRVYNMADLAHTANSITTTGVSLDSTDMSSSDLVGLTDGRKECASGDSISGN